MSGTYPMTQPDDHQQAYDRAMAHNAMLREALILQTEVISSYDVMEKSVKALNATEADATAWEKKLRQDVMLAVHPLQPEYEKLQQQLATVTAERDAELVAENERIGGLAEEWAGKYHALQAENERLKEMINANPAQA